MSDLKARVVSVQGAVAKLRADLPAIEWRAGQLLAQLAELAAIVGELAGQAPAVAAIGTPAAAAGKETPREEQLQRLAWMACRALPKGLVDWERDEAVCRTLKAWGVTDSELQGLGYVPAPPAAPVKREHGKCGGIVMSQLERQKVGA